MGATERHVAFPRAAYRELCSGLLKKWGQSQGLSTLPQSSARCWGALIALQVLLQGQSEAPEQGSWTVRTQEELVTVHGGSALCQAPL